MEVFCTTTTNLNIRTAKAIKDQAEKIVELSDFAYDYYKPIVDKIVIENTSEREVERLLDNMLGACYDDRLLELFKQVCRRYYKLYPEMIASEIFSYKELYEDNID